MRPAGETCTALAAVRGETVTVPAGTFRAVKLVCRNKATQAIRYEEWYAPELKHPVLLRERLTSGELRVRELTSYTVR